jgi:hypothetical protein
MSRKTQKWVVYLMLISMLITTILAGISMWRQGEKLRAPAHLALCPNKKGKLRDEEACLFVKARRIAWQWYKTIHCCG